MDDRLRDWAGRGARLACLLFVVFVVGFGSALAEPTAAPKTVQDLADLEAKVAAVVKQATPATVSVRSGGGSGSGVIISKDGYVLTAGHVAQEPGRPVTFIFPDGKTARGVSLGINHGVDAGLMKITEEGEWPFVEMGTMDGVEAGDWVVAMGHPGGFDIERPMVARLGRVYRVRSTVIQTDCTIIGGDSGGPLFDLDGKVVGIHSRISDSLRQNFHVPITMYSAGWDRLVAGEEWDTTGRIRAGGPYIGVRGQDGVEAGQGAAIGRVYKGSPADKAGLKQGDLIITFDRSPIRDFGELVAVVGKMEPGEKAPVIVVRDNKRVELEIEIGKATGGE